MVSRIIKMVLFIIYSYYNEGERTKGLAYFSAVGAFLGIVYLNFLTLLGMLGIEPGSLLPWWDPLGSRWRQFVTHAFLLLLPGYFFIRQMLPEKKIIDLNYDSRALSKGRILLLAYVAISFVVFVIVAFLRGS